MFGKVDDIRIYNWALSTSDIQALYGENNHASIEPLSFAGGFKIYPNPAKNFLYIENDVLGSKTGYSFEIRNMLGQTVLSGNVNGANRIDLPSNLVKGFYSLYLNDRQNKTVTVKKIVLQ
jgi:hypothetical protein